MRLGPHPFEWPEHWRKEWYERINIMCYSGNMKWQVAVRAAEADVRKQAEVDA